MRPHAAADPVSVCVRVKPVEAGQSPSLTRPEPGTNVRICDAQRGPRVLTNGLTAARSTQRIAVRGQREDGRAGEAREYEFGGGVLVDASQEDVFSHCAAGLCDDAVQRGVNGTILAYGQTGAPGALGEGESGSEPAGGWAWLTPRPRQGRARRTP